MQNIKNIDKEELIKLIKQSGLSIAKIAVLAGIKVGVLNNWLYTNARPTLHNATAVLNAIGYDLVAVRREK